MSEHDENKTVEPGSPKNDQMDAYVKEAKNVLSVAWAFLLKLFKSPMTAMEEGLPLVPAIAFAAVQPILVFVLIRVLFAQFMGLFMPTFGFGGLFWSPGFGWWVMVFFLTIVAVAASYAVLIVLTMLFAKLFCKAKTNFVQLFTQAVAAHVPLSLALIVAIIFGFFATSLALTALIVAYIASILLYHKALTVTIKADQNKIFFVLVCSFGATALLSMFFV